MHPVPAFRTDKRQDSRYTIRTFVSSFTQRVRWCPLVRRRSLARAHPKDTARRRRTACDFNPMTLQSRPPTEVVTQGPVYWPLTDLEPRGCNFRRINWHTSKCSVQVRRGSPLESIALVRNRECVGCKGGSNEYSRGGDDTLWVKRTEKKNRWKRNRVEVGGKAGRVNLVNALGKKEAIYGRN